MRARLRRPIFSSSSPPPLDISQRHSQAAVLPFVSSASSAAIPRVHSYAHVAFVCSLLNPESTFSNDFFVAAILPLSLCNPFRHRLANLGPQVALLASWPRRAAVVIVLPLSTAVKSCSSPNHPGCLRKMPPRGVTCSQRRSVFEPQCTHLTMTRIYDFTLLCAACRRPGPGGWVYHCSQDREDLIEHAICRGETASFDVLGHRMSKKLRIRRGSPAAREDRLSFFNEISHKQMSSYRPNQVAAILRQRENVQAVIQLQRLRNDSTEIINRRTYSNVFEGAPGPFDYKKPWVRSTQEECQYRICSRCRPGLADRAFLSLNAVARGEIPPTAAVGYGFHIMGERPIVDADVLKNLGCCSSPINKGEGAGARSVFDSSVPPQQPTPPSKTLPGRGSFRSRESIRQLFEGLPASIAQVAGEGFNEQRRQTSGTDTDTPGSLKHSPRCGNLGKYAYSSKDSSHGLVPRLLWTSPPSPNPNAGENLAQRQCQEVVPGGGVSKMKGPMSPGPDASPGSHKVNHDHPLAIAGSETCPLSQPEKMVSKGIVSPNAMRQSEGSGSQYAHTSSTRNLPQGMEKFTPSPLRVGHGVAVLEESVELGVPDVITHV